MSKSHRPTLRSVNITCEIVEKLKELNGVGVTELAKELDRSKSTIHDHLTTLEDNQLVVYESGSYRLSLWFLDAAAQIRGQFGNYEAIENELESVVEETSEIVQFGIEEHGRVSYLYKAVGEHGVETASSVGTQQPMHSTSLGKAILAYLPRDRVEEIFDRHGLPQRTENTITEREALFHELEEVRERGYAVDNEENVLGLRCIAAPVMDDDEVFGAVSVSGPSSRISDDILTNELLTLVKRAANVIELNSKFM